LRAGKSDLFLISVRAICFTGLSYRKPEMFHNPATESVFSSNRTGILPQYDFTTTPEYSRTVQFTPLYISLHKNYFS